MGKDIEKRAELIRQYYQQVSLAGTEAAKKEHFISLLTQLFGKIAPRVVNQFISGAEKSINNISRIRSGSEHGRADTQYANIIIEFEKNLVRTGAHAEDQLKEYLSGNWNSGIRSRFTLIATDCLTWRIYTLDYPSLFGLGTLNASELKFEKKEDFRVNPKAPDAFYFFLDRFLFRTEAIPATLEDIRRRFGHGSDIFQAVMIHMEKAYRSVENNTEMQVARDQWERLLRIAYGSFDAATHIFLIHSYLSVLAKMIAYEVISQDDFIDDSEMKDILSGEAFKRRNVANFTENDFYRWVARPDENLKKAFHIMADGLSEMDFSNVNEDILKGVYQELIDDDTRHDLGEYYTPDWLCARVVNSMDLVPSQKILDPSCGSGSFLKAAANRLISIEPSISASSLNSCLYGIDVHPLSVLIAKATMLITYGSRLAAETEPMHLNIFLANALLLPKEDVQQLMGGNYRILVDDSQVLVPSSAFHDTSFFEKLVANSEKLAEIDFRSGHTRSESEVMDIFTNLYNINDKEISRSAAQIHARLLKAKQMNRNGIWARGDASKKSLNLVG